MLKPQKTNSNFYHYSSIYNLKEYRNLASSVPYKYVICTNISKVDGKKTDDTQTKVMVAEF